MVSHAADGCYSGRRWTALTVRTRAFAHVCSSTCLDSGQQASLRPLRFVALGLRIGADNPVTDRLAGDIVGERDPITDHHRGDRARRAIRDSSQLPGGKGPGDRVGTGPQRRACRGPTMRKERPTSRGCPSRRLHPARSTPTSPTHWPNWCSHCSSANLAIVRGLHEKSSIPSTPYGTACTQARGAKSSAGPSRDT